MAEFDWLNVDKGGEVLMVEKMNHLSNKKEELKLTDLIDVETLQSIQDSFSNLVGLAAITTDANGVPITNGTNWVDFCMKHTRGSVIGNERCMKCDRMGAEAALYRGKSQVYECHAGLYDFAAPIMANGKMVGCFLGGQVLAQEPDMNKFCSIADELGIDSEKYCEAVRKVTVMPKEEIDKAADFLYQIANVLSTMAYSKYLTYKANKEIKRTSEMKSDFLANMSHEIRTPMNAVIGMAEMALREDISPTAREYICQIKSSGQTLLTIINDLLDFSKIESGKMDIVQEEYETMSVLHDVVGIVATRLKDKKLEFIVDVDPNLPEKLYGDVVRNKQILINLANNAAKFTNNGYVAIRVKFDQSDEENIQLKIEIEDTGIGIKENQVKYLFDSFYQVDNKRNRNIEGTGLGLAITKNLLDMMHGDIEVESVYNQGSTFSYKVPQKIVEKNGIVNMEEMKKFHIWSVGVETLALKQLKIDAIRLGMDYQHFSKVEDIDLEAVDENTFLFVEHGYFSSDIEDFIRNHKKLTAVVMVDFFAVMESDIPNLRIIRKPVYVLNLVQLLENKENVTELQTRNEGNFEFIAPEANVLIVDDNPVNLVVAEGLLEPLKMKIETATSGLEAIDKISSQMFDLILMDHMMPEMDGVETVHIIRECHKEYENIPIIMLTANAIEGTKQMFLKEGLNDFVSKPIEVKVLVSAIARWLPKEKIVKQKIFSKNTEPSKKESIKIGDLDVRTAMERLGSEDLFWTVLKKYYKSIDKKSKVIEETWKNSDWSQYIIEVHALKSTSKQIGADYLSELAKTLELAGKAGEYDTIHQKTEELLIEYLKYVPVLEPYFKEEDKEEDEKEEMEKDLLLQSITDMELALESLDMIQMEKIMEDLKNYKMSKQDEEYRNQLDGAVEVYDADLCEEILAKWKKTI